MYQYIVSSAQNALERKAVSTFLSKQNEIPVYLVSRVVGIPPRRSYDTHHLIRVYCIAWALAAGHCIMLHCIVFCCVLYWLTFGNSEKKNVNSCVRSQWQLDKLKHLCIIQQNTLNLNKCSPPPPARPRLPPPKPLVGPRAALGMTWEGVPSIRLLLEDRPIHGPISSPNDDAGGGNAGLAARTGTLLKHPAKVWYLLLCCSGVVLRFFYLLNLTFRLKLHPYCCTWKSTATPFFFFYKTLCFA